MGRFINNDNSIFQKWAEKLIGQKLNGECTQIDTGITGVGAWKFGNTVILRFYDMPIATTTGSLPQSLIPKYSMRSIVYNPQSTLCGSVSVAVNGTITITKPSGVTQGYWYGQCVYFLQ